MEVHAVKTWFDTRHGVVEVTDDVLGVIQQVKAIDPRLKVYYNKQTGGYDLVEACLDRTERLVFSVAALDQRVVDRLHQADHWGTNHPDYRDKFRPEGEDFLTQLDAAQERDQEELMEPLRQRLGDAAERLCHAMDQGGPGVQDTLWLPGDKVPWLKGKHDGPDDSGGVQD